MSLLPPAADGASLSEAFGRATETAGAVPGAYADAPCRFVPVPESLGAAGHEPTSRARWFLVVSRPAHDTGQQTHVRERSLTAAQRFMLSLACDDIDAAWHNRVPDARHLAAEGVDLSGGTPVGMIRCEPGR